MDSRDNADGPQAQAFTFQTLEPPRVPTDLIASALLVRLEDIAPKHQGRKLRITAQILHFDPRTDVLLLVAYPHRPGALSATLLVDVTVPFLGQSPATRSVYPEDNVYSRHAAPTAMSTQAGHPGRGVKGTAREMLKLHKGEWVHVIGWLEGDASKYHRIVEELFDTRYHQDPAVSIDSGQCDRPFHTVLEAILITQARPPPLDALYR